MLDNIVFIWYNFIKRGKNDKIKGVLCVITTIKI